MPENLFLVVCQRIMIVQLGIMGTHLSSPNFMKRKVNWHNQTWHHGLINYNSYVIHDECIIG